MTKANKKTPLKRIFFSTAVSILMVISFFSQSGSANEDFSRTPEKIIFESPLGTKLTGNDLDSVVIWERNLCESIVSSDAMRFVTMGYKIDSIEISNAFNTPNERDLAVKFIKTDINGNVIHAGLAGLHCKR